MSRVGLAALVVAAVGWGSLSVTTTVALRGFGPWTVLVGELAVAVLVLGVATVAAGQRLPRLSMPLVGLGLLEPAVAYLTFTFGVQRTSSAHAGLLLGLETVFLVLLGMLLLGERPRPGALTGVGLAVAGVAVLSWHPGGTATLLGDALVLLDAFAAALAVILTAQLVRDIPALALTTMQFAIGLVIVTPLAAVAWLSGAEISLPGSVQAGPVVALLITGSLGTAGAFLLNNWALARVSATTAGAAITLIPLFALALSTLLLDEPLTASTGIAGALILAGLACYLRSTRDIEQHTSAQHPVPDREPVAP